VSTTALITRFGIGIAATAGRHVFGACLVSADAALVMLASVLALMMATGAHPGIAERAGLGRTSLPAACLADHVRPDRAGHLAQPGARRR
jgi:hypothetical protein